MSSSEWALSSLPRSSLPPFAVDSTVVSVKFLFLGPGMVRVSSLLCLSVHPASLSAYEGDVARAWNKPSALLFF